MLKKLREETNCNSFVKIQTEGKKWFRKHKYPSSDTFFMMHFNNLSFGFHARNSINILNLGNKSILSKQKWRDNLNKTETKSTLSK